MSEKITNQIIKPVADGETTPKKKVVKKKPLVDGETTPKKKVVKKKPLVGGETTPKKKVVKKKPLVGGETTKKKSRVTIGEEEPNKKLKKVLENESWDELIRYEENFKERSKKEKALMEIKVKEDKRKLNIFLFILLSSVVVIIFLISYFEIGNKNIFKQKSSYFFNR